MLVRARMIPISSAVARSFPLMISTVTGSMRIVNVTNSTLSGNVADAGGGIANGTGTVNVTNSTLSGNHAGFDGGGIANGTGTVNVTNSTLSGNSSRSSGGGITNFNGALNVINSTVSGNFTVCPGSCDGGGI